MSEFGGTHQNRLKLRFVKPEGKISRRELLKLVLPRYEVIPFIEPALCRGNKECGLCLATCPLQAIKVEGDEVIIDTTLCTGCGACTVTCPPRAIVYPTFSLERLDKEMESALLPQGTLLESRIIALICQNCLPAPDKDSASQLLLPPNVRGLKIPCLAMASPWLLLRAFDRGAQGLALIANRKCSVKLDPNIWQENVRFVQSLLECWQIEPQRIRAFAMADDFHKVVPELDQFAQEMAPLAPTPLGLAEPTALPGDGLLLPALIKGLADKVGGSAKGAVVAGLVPFGKLEVGAQCSGCGLCALDCPTEALTASASAETDSYQLLFRHDWCVACGRCVGVCPEKCLQLGRILELDRIDSPAAVLFEDRIARCRHCGSIIGSRAMIEKLQAKLLVMGEAFTAQLELCPACKVKDWE
ncbi:MAG: 4Fe-4S binding protein [Chloroflexi bacterium]|nr:4Fe-4S binding protein [Chloroflexota bacterium]